MLMNFVCGHALHDDVVVGHTSSHVFEGAISRGQYLPMTTLRDALEVFAQISTGIQST